MIRNAAIQLVNTAFRQGAREGFSYYLPYSLGLLPWGLVTGIAMRDAGFSFLEAMGMSIIVFGGTAQLGTLPLIVSGAPAWLIVLTALALNLRFLIFSAILAPAFNGVGKRLRWLSGYLLSDGVVAACASRLLREERTDWRLGYYLAPSLWNWALWQASSLAGILLADVVPQGWSLEFMATIAMLVLLVPMVRQRPMLLAALVGGGTAVLLHGLPLRLGLFVAIVLGMAAGFVAEYLQREKSAHG
ncbi:AzlC family ABC transporter permease [Vogesella facilis]|uniref:AzlC family ABC transporter permease n=1 Tax=Vogesella facilis TaxID=1655232 RepID=A0ABV7RFJ1_9NEIS